MAESAKGIKTTRELPSIGSMPTGRDWLEVDFSIPATTYATVNVNNTPTLQILSLWEFYFSLRIDVNDDDHLFPSGSALTSAQRSLTIQQWKDFANSFDVTGARMHKIRLNNFDSSAHTYYLLYKAYSFSTVTGTQESA